MTAGMDIGPLLVSCSLDMHWQLRQMSAETTCAPNESRRSCGRIL